MYVFYCLMIFFFNFSKSTAQSGLFALEWTSLLVEQGLNKCTDIGKNEFQRLVETQAILISIIVAAGNSK